MKKVDEKVAEKNRQLKSISNQRVLTYKKFNKELDKNNEKLKIAEKNRDEKLNLLRERMVEIESILNGTYIISEAIEQYNILLEKINEIIDVTKDKRLLRFVYDIEKRRNSLQAGKKAEKEAVSALKLWNNKVEFLANARFIFEDIDVEEDLIVIASTGVFSIEVKNWKGSAVLNQNGILYSKENKKYSIDIIKQGNMHCYCLRCLLEKESAMNEKGAKNHVYPIILWQNNFSDLEDNFKKVPVCCTNTLEDEIMNCSKYEICFSEEDIEKIYSLLLKSKMPERQYPINSDLETFVDDYSSILKKIIEDEYQKEFDLNKQRSGEV